jgi:hypothetical protein
VPKASFGLALHVNPFKCVQPLKELEVGCEVVYWVCGLQLQHRLFLVFLMILVISCGVSVDGKL